MKIENDKFYKRLFGLAFPIAIQSLMLALVAAGDALMLGRVGQDEMTSVSLATQIQFVQNMVIYSVTGAGAILGAQYFGKGDKRTLENLFHIMLRLCIGVSILFFIGCEFFPQYLMAIFTGSDKLNALGCSYLRIAGYSYLLTGISQCYLTIMKVSDHVPVSAFISSGAVVINIVLNAVFIFGLLFCPAMGVKGAALATTLARIIELALCISFSYRKDYIRPELKTFFDKKPGLIQDFFKQCIPLLGGSMLWGVGFTSYTAIIGHMGENAAAANSIASVVRDLICCVCNGIGSAAGIMVGYEFGAGNLEKGKAYGIKLVKISYVIGFVSTGFVLLITPLVVRMVILTDEARYYLVGMMIIMAVYMIGRCVNTVAINGVLDGGGDTVFDMYSLAVCMWVIAIPLALLGAFVFHWHVFAVYACTCLDEVGKIPWVMVRLKKYKWVQDLTK